MVRRSPAPLEPASPAAGGASSQAQRLGTHPVRSLGRDITTFAVPFPHVSVWARWSLQASLAPGLRLEEKGRRSAPSRAGLCQHRFHCGASWHQTTQRPGRSFLERHVDALGLSEPVGGLLDEERDARVRGVASGLLEIRNGAGPVAPRQQDPSYELVALWLFQVRPFVRASSTASLRWSSPSTAPRWAASM